MKTSKKVLAVLLALVMVFTFAACGSSDPAPAPAPAPDNGGSAPADDSGSAAADWDGTITIVQSSDVITFDPCASTDVNTKNCYKNLMNRCFETDDLYNPIPVLVKSYENPDPLTWNFEIQSGVKFIDGNELTTEDVIFCYERAKETSSSGKTLFGPVEEFIITGDYTFTIKTAYPYASMTTAMSNGATGILEKEWVEKVDKGECSWEDVMRNGVTGRYYLGERVLGDHTELVKNPDYWNPDDAAMNERLIFKIIPEATTRTIMLQTGEADVNVNFDTATMKDVENDENVTILQHEASDIYYLALNCEVGPFTNKAVRQAVANAVDRDACLTVGTEGYGKAWYNLMGPNVIGVSENPAGYAYDIEKAKSLLASAGLSSVDIKGCCYNDEGERVIQVIQATLSQAGINLSYDRIDNTILTEVVANNEYDLVVDHTASYNDPELFFGRYFAADGIGAKNYAHYDNPEINAIIAETTSTLDEAAREAGYKKVNEMLCEDCPKVGLYCPIIWAACRKGVQGVNLSNETTYYYHTIRYE